MSKGWAVLLTGRFAISRRLCFQRTWARRGWYVQGRGRRRGRRRIRMTPAAAKADQDNATRDSPTCYGTVTAFKIVTQRVFSRYRVKLSPGSPTTSVSYGILTGSLMARRYPYAWLIQWGSGSDRFESGRAVSLVTAKTRDPVGHRTPLRRQGGIRQDIVPL